MLKNPMDDALLKGVLTTLMLVVFIIIICVLVHENETVKNAVTGTDVVRITIETQKPCVVTCSPECKCSQKENVNEPEN